MGFSDLTILHDDEDVKKFNALFASAHFQEPLWIKNRLWQNEIEDICLLFMSSS